MDSFIDSEWLDRFIEQELAWLVEAKRRGVGVEGLTIAERLLERLVSAKAQAASRRFSVDEAARITGLHAETIRRFAREGRLGDHQTGDRISLTLDQVRQLGVREKAQPDKTGSLVDYFAPRNSK